jgi:DNA-binding NarL/FixJ family response regulator
MEKALYVRLLIADNHKLTRCGLVEILNAEKDLFVIGEADDGDELVDLYFMLNPDVLIMDESMPKKSGLDAFKKIKEKDPGVKAIFLSNLENPAAVYQCYKYGVKAYLEKTVLIGELLLAIQTASYGEIYHGGSFSKNRLLQLTHLYKAEGIPDDENISTDFNYREEQILYQIGRGLQSKEIAEQLAVSRRTVDMYRSQLMEKLELRNMQELIVFAVKYSFSKQIIYKYEEGLTM